ncbi:DUF3631 domain-containing protein [Flavobacterium sp.]|jgi:putative DNA primase/helicase|uniref:DUF3631 domain-containing protein n=1 Tax=Flavobacterium sp. TaxID=239 RepID=UPI0037BFC527
MKDSSSKTSQKTTSGGSNPMLPEAIPSPEPIEPAALLDSILAVILQHVIIDSAQAVAVTLWIAMTWFMPSINVAPLLIITAPERACGKSQLLAIALRLVFKGLSASNTSASFLFRALESWQPTILIDEADTFIRENAEIKGMLNAGHTRESAYVGRAVSKDGDFEPVLFCVWGAKVLAGIALEKHLSDPTMSRSIVASMRRKLPSETILRLRHAEKSTFDVLASQLARFAQDYADQIANARPNLPDALSDRAQDNWEPLLAIAECAGDAWVEKAISAALTLSKSTDESASTGNELLDDIHTVFSARSESKISSAELIEALVADSESPWATYNRGRPLTPRQLSKMLSAYGIKSKTVRLSRFDTPKGYERDQFTDVFSRYLTQSPPDEKEPLQAEATPSEENPFTEICTNKPGEAFDKHPDSDF